MFWTEWKWKYRIGLWCSGGSTGEEKLDPHMATACLNSQPSQPGSSQACAWVPKKPTGWRIGRMGLWCNRTLWRVILSLSFSFYHACMCSNMTKGGKKKIIHIEMYDTAKAAFTGPFIALCTYKRRKIFN